jgi:hypothetical protein
MISPSTNKESVMDDELFLTVYQLTTQRVPRRGKRQQFSDAVIASVYLWSVIRNKPMEWACQRAHAPPPLADRPLPSVSTLSRRVRSDAVRQLLDRIEAQLLELTQTALVGCWLIDAKPLPVSPYSKDKQARRGWAYNGYARGYKLFAVCDLDQRIVGWRVHAMNQAEPTVARSLLAHLDGPGYLLGDSIYDSTPLHEAAAAQQVQLIAPRKSPEGNIGVRARHPNRLHAVAMLETHVNRFGPTMYARRTAIERAFSRLAASSVGLDHLPGWVRGLGRVRRWVQAKLILFATQN